MFGGYFSVGLHLAGKGYFPQLSNLGSVIDTIEHKRMFRYNPHLMLGHSTTTRCRPALYPHMVCIV